MTYLIRSESEQGYWSNDDGWMLHPESATEFSKEETANIVSRCKQNYVSVNTGLVTAFLYAEKQLFERKDYSSNVIIADNLRTHLKNQPGESLGFFISTVRPVLK